MVKFNLLLLMSALISINLHPADQTGLLLLPLQKEGEEEERWRAKRLCRQTFMTQKSLLNGLEDSSHLAPRGWKRKEKKERAGGREGGVKGGGVK